MHASKRSNEYSNAFDHPPRKFIRHQPEEHHIFIKEEPQEEPQYQYSNSNLTSTESHRTSNAGGINLHHLASTGEDGLTDITTLAPEFRRFALKHKCRLCDSLFKSEEALLQHSDAAHGLSVSGNKHSSDKPYHCPICQKRFKSLSSREQHCVTAHPEEVQDAPTNCEHCNKRFSSYGQLVQHVATAHGGNNEIASKQKKADQVVFYHNCSECSKSFPRYLSYVAHMQAKHMQLNGVLVCQTCDCPFLSKESFENHRCTGFQSNVGHSETMEVFQCPDCHATLSSQMKYEKHWHYTHNKHNLFNCGICHKAFLEDSSYQQHVSAHKDGDDKRFIIPCNFCDQLFDKNDTLNQHTKSYHYSYEKDKTRKCKKCGGKYVAFDWDSDNMCKLCLFRHKKMPKKEASDSDFNRDVDSFDCL